MERPRTVAVDPRRLKEFLRPAVSISETNVISFDGPTSAAGPLPNQTIPLERVISTAGSSTRPRNTQNLYQRTSCRGELKAFTDPSGGGVCLCQDREPSPRLSPRSLWFTRRIDIPDDIKSAVAAPKNSMRATGLVCEEPRVFGGRVLLGSVEEKAVRLPISASDESPVFATGVMHPSLRRSLLEDEVRARCAKQQVHYARMTLHALQSKAAREPYAPPSLPTRPSNKPLRVHTAPSAKVRDAILGIGLSERQTNKRAIHARPQDMLKIFLLYK